MSLFWYYVTIPHLQESSDAFQDKTYSSQVPLFTRTGHKEQHQVGVHWNKGPYCRYHHQFSLEGDLSATRMNFFSKLINIIFNIKVVASNRARAQGEICF